MSSATAKQHHLRNALINHCDDNTLPGSSPVNLVFPGGGIYFYWQAGVVSFLREQNYNLDSIPMVGASAGALTATLTATNVDFFRATDLALQLAADAGVWNRSGGLQGIWGPMIHNWLDELLPDDAVERVQGQRLSLLLTPVPQFGKELVNQFVDKEDLIRCNLASVHLPYFLDSRLTAKFRGHHYIDGSFLARPQDYHTSKANNILPEILVLDYKDDPLYQTTRWFDFVEAAKPKAIYGMMQDGRQYASVAEERGLFSPIPKIGLV